MDLIEYVLCISSSLEGMLRGADLCTAVAAIRLQMSAAEKRGSLGRGRSGTSAQSSVLCFSVF